MKIFNVFLFSLILIGCTSQQSRHPSSLTDNSGIKIDTPDYTTVYTYEDYINRSNDDLESTWWHLWYHFKLDLEGFEKSACYLGSKAPAKDLLVDSLNSKIIVEKKSFMWKSSREVDTVIYVPGGRGIQLKVLDRSSDFEEKIIIIQKCE